MKGKVLIIDAAHPSLKVKLEKIGFECVEKSIHYPQLLEEAHLYTGFVIRSRFAIDKNLLDAATSLRFVARIGAGMENIDIGYVFHKNIACLNSPEGNADAVGEFVIGGLLSLFRNIKKADSEVREGFWLREENRGIELASKTVGIIGYGNMGKALAKKLSGFGCQVIAFDKYKTDFSDNYAQEVDLPTLQAEADIVSIHINYLPQNHYFVNKELLNGFAKEIYLVNTSRGMALSTDDLTVCLNNGKVKGAILDVLEYEDIRLRNRPMEEWERSMYLLAASDDVILSPHIAGQTIESLTKHVNVLIEKIENLPFLKENKDESQ